MPGGQPQCPMEALREYTGELLTSPDGRPPSDAWRPDASAWQTPKPPTHTQEDLMTAPTTVDEYLAALPEDRRTALQALRKTIRAAAPDATESIAYQMPAFRMGKQFLVSYAAFKAHTSLFPASDAVVRAMGDELAPYLHGKGTIQFPLKVPIPLSMVTRIVEIRVAENAARGAG